MDVESIGLAEAVRELRAELSEAMSAGEGEHLRFALESVEMEFTVAVTKDAHAEAGIKFWVVNAGAKAGLSSQETHRLKLSLAPKDVVTGHPPEIADEE